MYNILLSKQRGICFPIMCNAFIRIDYSDNIPDTSSDGSTTDDIGYGLWAHTGSFTLESVVTPYDINGYGKMEAYGSGRVLPSIPNSKKIMPSNWDSSSSYGANRESQLYMPVLDRLSHNMTIFNNTNFWFGLVNTTLHNENQPAEYKLRVRISLPTGGIEEFDSPTCIKAAYDRNYIYTSLFNNFNGNGRINHLKIGQGTSVTSNTNIQGVFDTTNVFTGSKLELFARGTYQNKSTYHSLGYVTSSNVTQLGVSTALSAEIQTLIGATADIYIRGDTEPSYINDAFHLAVAYNDLGKSLDFYCNGRLLSTHTHTGSNSFVFDKSDCTIGSISTSSGADTANTNKQFMGELHELSIISTYKNEFSSLFNLLPNYENTLLYLRFEEIDA
jgi:hypothetical protein